MHKHSVGIVGASGYSGLELTGLVARHPRLQLAFATSDRFVGERLSKRALVGGPAGALPYVAQAETLAAAKGVDVVFLATPAEVSLELAPKLLAQGRTNRAHHELLA